MEIAYKNSQLQEFCTKNGVMSRKFGEPCARLLRRRIVALRAAMTLESLRGTPGKWEELKHDRKGELSARLEGGLRLIFRPTVQPPPSKEDGGLDWRLVDAVTITDVGDYH